MDKKELMDKIDKYQKKWDKVIEEKGMPKKYWDIVGDIGRPGSTDIPSDFRYEFEYLSEHGLTDKMKKEAKELLELL